MTGEEETDSSVVERVLTGVSGLDAVLRGGFFRGGVYMIVAAPGSGKTILGNQIAFGHVGRGGRALYVTLLTESHARLIASLRSFAFFDPAAVGTSISYVTAYQALEKENLKGLLGLLRRIIRAHRATLLVIDGFVTAGSIAKSDLETKKFIHELQAFVELVGCTTLLLTGGSEATDEYALRTMVDGLLRLRQETLSMEQARTIPVRKFRGGAVLTGRHLMEIGDAGITVFPRTESHRGKKLERPIGGHAVGPSFGVAALDRMLGDGLRPGSVTMILGAAGTGKTLLGMSALVAGANAGERGVYFGFFEAPADVTRRSEAIGLPIEAGCRRGQLDLVWQSPDTNADALAETILSRARQGECRRVFIDGVEALTDSLVYPARLRRFFAALFEELRALGVVTIVSDDTRSGRDIVAPDHGLGALLDNVLSLRHVEVGGRTRRYVAVAKMRDTLADASPRELSFTARGLVVAASAGPREKGRAAKRRGRPGR